MNQKRASLKRIRKKAQGVKAMLLDINLGDDRNDHIKQVRDSIRELDIKRAHFIARAPFIAITNAK